MSFKNKLGAASTSPLSQVVAMVQSTVSAQNGTYDKSRVARAALSMENIDDSGVADLRTAVDGMKHAMEQIGASLFSDKKTQLSAAQTDAAVTISAIVGDIAQYMQAPTQHRMVSTESIGFVDARGVGDGFEKRVPAFEAYDEKDNRNAIVYSITYNLRSARQDEFGEAFFPTVVVAPDAVGFGVNIRLIQVYNDLKRDISGALDNYNKKNIINAVVDHTILKNDSTQIVPVKRAESAANFAAFGGKTILLDDEPIATGPLLPGKKFSLLAIGQTDTLLANGLMGPTDSIDSAISLKNIYIKVGADVIPFPVLNTPTANFVAAPQGNYRLQNLAYTNDSLLVNASTKRIDGSALTELNGVITNDLIVRLSVHASGSVNQETGDTIVYGNSVEVKSIQDATGAFLDLATAPAAAIVAKFAAGAGTIGGYDLESFRTNSNRRQRGQLLDTTFYTQYWAVPLRSPISVLRPVTADGQNDAADLGALITATQIRTSNAAVTTLLETATILNNFVDSRDTSGVTPEVLGIARLLVKPQYISDTLDMATAINSLTSHERAADTQAVLVNKLREMIYRMYRNSNFKAAADAQAGGQSATPTVIIGTDQILSRYLMIDGDLRTIGPDFNVKVVTTQDARMGGRIAIAFGYFEAGGENRPNAMHFGNMAWKPEATLVLPISRDGQISKELTVQPSFRHIVNSPILGMLEVSGIEDVIASKVSIDMSIV